MSFSMQNIRLFDVALYLSPTAVCTVHAPWTYLQVFWRYQFCDGVIWLPPGCACFPPVFLYWSFLYRSSFVMLCNGGSIAKMKCNGHLIIDYWDAHSDAESFIGEPGAIL